MSKVEQWVVEKEHAGKRLDSAISERYKEISRTQIQDMLKGGEITVNESSSKPGLKLKGGEKIIIRLREEEPEMTIKATGLDFPVLFEDRYIIVINKPAGLVVHPGAGKEQTTVVSALLSHTRLSPVGAPTRPGVVHRLDKETSGIMVLAKTKEAHKKLAAAFAGHELEKEYQAIIQGHIVNRKGRIEVAIERDRIHRKRMKATSAEKGKMAISIFEVSEYLNGASLVKVKILTGRTHQIRVHMAFTGHPLLGDITYGGKKTGKKAQHFLHSSRLKFNHPITGKELCFSAPLPEDFNKMLEQLRNSNDINSD